MQKYSGIWSDQQLKHLLRRTLFGVTAADYKFFHGKSMDECVAILLTSSPTAPAPPVYWDTKAQDVKPGNTWVFNAKVDDGEEMHRMDFIQMWLIEQMRSGRNITERMVFFWHNHFATEAAMVKDSRYCYQYFALMRQYATGNFKKLLKEMTINPQMLVYLNGNLNVKTAPNENYAREVQELFTVGKGPGSHYTEEDVQQAAKVLTGWKEDKDKITSFFDPNEHNAEDKTFSAFYNNHVIKGKDGAAGADETFELLDMLCGQKEVSKFLCRKLYRWFVNSHIDEQVESNVITALAEIMVKADYEMKPVLKALLTSDFFYEPYLIGSIIKSPLDFITELFRQFDIRNPFQHDEQWRLVGAFCQLAARMGQNIGDPPQVAGWSAYYAYPLFDKEWITADRLYERNELIRIMSRKVDKVDIENNAIYDLVAFVSPLSKPDNAVQLVDDAIAILFCVPPGKDQTTYLHDLLNKGKAYTQNWSELWTMYHADKAKEDLAEEVKDRLRITFETMLSYPEFQVR